MEREIKMTVSPTATCTSAPAPAALIPAAVSTGTVPLSPPSSGTAAVGFLVFFCFSICKEPTWISTPAMLLLKWRPSEVRPPPPGRRAHLRLLLPLLFLALHWHHRRGDGGLLGIGDLEPEPGEGLLVQRDRERPDSADHVIRDNLVLQARENGLGWNTCNCRV